MEKNILLCMVTFNRVEMTKRCLQSLLATANPELYSLFIVDNGSEDGTVDLLKSITNPQVEDIIYNDSNLGTASALNIGWKIAHDRDWHAGKLDNDVVFKDTSWLSRMKYAVETVDDLGLVGLKRVDLEEKPNHTNAFFRTRFYVLPNNSVIEIANHVMGTCWLVNRKALKKLGGLRQLGPYGLDDSLFCFRMALAGYYVAFIPDLAIEHIDPGHSKYPEYTQWKIDEAGRVLKSGAYDEIKAAYQGGKRPLWEPFE